MSPVRKVAIHVEKFRVINLQKDEEERLCKKITEVLNTYVCQDQKI